MGDYAQSDFDTLYRDNYNNLLRLAYRSTKDYHESEDLVDEAFFICRNLGLYILAIQEPT